MKIIVFLGMLFTSVVSHAASSSERSILKLDRGNFSLGAELLEVFRSEDGNQAASLGPSFEFFFMNRVSLGFASRARVWKASGVILDLGPSATLYPIDFGKFSPFLNAKYLYRNLSGNSNALRGNRLTLSLGFEYAFSSYFGFGPKLVYVREIPEQRRALVGDVGFRFYL